MDEAGMIVHLNVQGLTSHITEVRQLVSERKPLVLCVSETHVTSDIIEQEISILGYNTIICPSNSRHTGGSILYIQYSFKFEVLTKDALEYGFWAIWARIHIKGETIVVGTIYRSPSGNCKIFLEYLENKLNEDICQQLRMVLLGDLNIDLLKDNANMKALMKIIEAAGLRQIVTEATRITNKSATLIDHIITGDYDARELPRNSTPIGDHEIIAVEMMFSAAHAHGGSTKMFHRRLNDEVVSEITTQLVGADWNYTSTDVNVIYGHFMNIIENAVDKAAPRKNQTSSKYPWVNEVVRKIQKERDLAYRRFVVTRGDTDWRRYQVIRNEVISRIRSEKKKYFENNIDKCKGDSKKMWRTLKELLGSKKQNTDFTNVNFGNYEGTTEEKFNSFYRASLEEISNNIENRQWEAIVNEGTGVELVNFEILNISELRKIIFDLKNKGTSDDFLSVRLIRDLFCVIGYPLLYLINTSLETGKVPNELKTSIMIPIPKVSKPTTPEDFRPINLLPVIDKIIEKIVYLQLSSYLEKNNLLYIGQSGFRYKHSCETALQYICARWRHEINKENVVISIFVDLKRAFETVDREILIKKLRSFNVKGVVLNWIEDYLSYRYNRTKIDNRCSEKIESRLGVPQGSILGPLLFIVYVNDINTVLKKSFVNLFADDTVLCVAGKNFLEVTDRINSELNFLYDWLCKNRLKLNTSKTKCMVLGSKTKCKKFSESNLRVCINEVNIDYVSEIKYLGVVLDPQLSFSLHIDYMCRKLGKKNSFFARISAFLSEWTRRQVFNTIILPHFNYCSALLISCTQGDINRLQIQQNKSMRIILRCSKLTPVVVMHNELNWLPVGKIIKKANLTLIYKIEHDLVPRYLKDFLERRGDFYDYNIRSGNDFNICTVRTTSLQKSLFYEGVRLYNGLPEEIKSSPSLKTFCKKLYSHLRGM